MRARRDVRARRGLLTVDCDMGVCGPSSCDDGVQNRGEAGVDCGGPCPFGCTGLGCTTDEDCVSGRCYMGSCVSCVDRIMNADETDVDCGGSCDPCTSGQMCLAGTDCESGTCDGTTCAP